MGTLSDLPVPRALRILVVDDEPSMRQVLSAYFSTAGHTIATASNGVEALERLNEQEWDVVLTDRLMPSKGGDELASEIKALHPQLPIIMVAGSLERQGGKFVQVPNVDYLVRKPFSLRALSEAIVAVTNKN
jgi:CheY-like chemotaxis protein